VVLAQDALARDGSTLLAAAPSRDQAATVVSVDQPINSRIKQLARDSKRAS